MRKYWKIGMFGLAAALMLAGCSANGSGFAKTQAEADAQKTEENVAVSSVTLGDYKGISVKAARVEVTDEEVESQIQRLLESYPDYVEVEREARDGDMVNIDYKGLLDGVAFDGGTAEAADLELGSGSFIDGFEAGLLGVKKGEERSLNLTFPENYGSQELAGKAVVFEVKVNSVKEKVIPKLTDEFVASNFPEEKDAENLRKSMQKLIEEQKQQNSDLQRDQSILETVLSNSQVVCATSEVDEQYNSLLKDYTNEAAMYGMDFATYASMYGMDEEGLKGEIRKMAEESAKQKLILGEIAKQENIVVEDADRDALAREQGYVETGEELAEMVGQEKVDEVALLRKVLKFLTDNAEITEVDPKELLQAGADADLPLEEGLAVETAPGENSAKAAIEELPDTLELE